MGGVKKNPLNPLSLQIFLRSDIISKEFLLTIQIDFEAVIITYKRNQLFKKDILC